MLLLASLAGCTLSAPKEEELFSPSTGSGDASRDAATDAARSDGGAQQELDSGAVTDAGNPSNVEEAGNDAEQDAAPAVFDPQAGLVVHYRFNETTGNTVNDFAGDKDALIVGTPASFTQWISAGHSDGALKLAGGAAPDGGTGHYVELPPGVLIGMPEASIALWLNRAGGPMWQRVFDLGSGPPSWLYFTANGGTGLPIVAGRTPALIFVDYTQIATAQPNEGLLRINQSIPIGTWVHFVLTWTSTELKVYLNGKLAGSAAPHGSVTPADLGNTTQNYLGRSQFAPDPYFDGMIDEFRIYDRALSAGDVTKLYEVP